jgi:flavodoxin
MQSLDPTSEPTKPVIEGTESGPARFPPPELDVHRRALVVYYSRYGNTKRIALALAKGLGSSPGVVAVCQSVGEVNRDELSKYDFLAVGAPTEIHSAAKPMKEFLRGIEGVPLKGKHGFGFDTRMDLPLSGSAAKFIEKHLERLGVEIVHPPRSALVRPMTKEEGKEHSGEFTPSFARKHESSSGGKSSGELDLLIGDAEADFTRIGAELGRILSGLPIAAA